MKKYELTQETKDIGDKTLFRIRALVDIGPGVKAGDFGGWIESEHNLSHNGDCWVSGNARVFGNAQVFENSRVSGDTYVYGNAQVFGYAYVYGNALVSGSARVSGDAQVFGNAQVFENSRVFGNARVSGDTYVYGNAQVFGYAYVYGNAQVFGGARVLGNAQVFGGARVLGNARLQNPSDIFTASHVGTENGTLTVFRGVDGPLVARGCFFGTPEKFLASSKANHDDKTRLEYELLIKVGLSRIGYAPIGEQQ